MRRVRFIQSNMVRIEPNKSFTVFGRSPLRSRQAMNDVAVTSRGVCHPQRANSLGRL